MSGFSIGKIREHIPVLILEQSGTLATEQEVFPIVRKMNQELEEEFLQADHFSSGKASSTTVSSKSLSTWVSWMMIDNCCVCRFLVGLWEALT